MTAPPKPVAAGCDVCGAEPAYASLMVLATYEQTKLGLACIPEFFSSIVVSMTGAAPAPAPRPGDPPAAPAAPRVLDEDPVTGDMVPLITAAEAAAPPPEPAASPRREAAARGGTPEAAQLAVLQLLGITRPDEAQCPECATTSYTAPGMGTFVCPWCGTCHGPGWAGIERALTAPPPGTLAPAAEAGEDPAPDVGEQATAQAGHQAAADPGPGTPDQPEAGPDDGVSRETSADEAPF